MCSYHESKWVKSNEKCTCLRVDTALAEFTTITNDIPSGLPHPDGAARIRKVSLQLAVARHKMAEAQTQLNDYLNRGRFTSADHPLYFNQRNGKAILSLYPPHPIYRLDGS